MKRIYILEHRKKELEKRIHLSEIYKKRVEQLVQSCLKKYTEKEITLSEYHAHLERHFKGKTPEEWINYYDKYISECKKHLEKVISELKKEKAKKIAFHPALFLSLILGTLILVFLLAGKLSLTGFTIADNETLINQTFPTNLTINETLSEAQNITITEKDILTIRSEIKIGEDVKWTKTISTKEKTGEISLPDSAKNITLRKIKDGSEKEKKSLIQNENITIINDADEYIIEFFTMPPEKTEKVTSFGKTISISAPEELNYTDVLAFTQLPEILDISQKDKIRIYWRENKNYLSFNASDKNGNGKIDYIEWKVPHLSNQTFDIILITKAEHLDENKVFFSDIYDSVKELDGNWSETIPNQHYVRVTFEQNLTKERDITIYPRIISGNPKIEIYEYNSSTKIAEFSSLNQNQYNSITLSGLISQSQDVFDLRISGGSVQFEHIIDPFAEEWVEDCVDISEWTLDPAGGWASTGGSCTSTNSVDDNMTRATDLTGRTSATLRFNWENAKLDAGEWFRVYAGTTTPTLVLIFANQGDGSTQSGSENIDITSYISATTTIRFQCFGSDGGESCNIDNLNLTTFSPADEQYPIFSNFQTSPANNSAYILNRIHQFNTTILSTNGTVGLEFNGVNRTASNLSNVFNVSIRGLGAGTYNYYWWGYGNGTSQLFNRTQVFSYTIAQAQSNVTIWLNNSESNITITSGTAILLNASLTSGDTGNLILFRNTSAINTGTSPLSNLSTFSTAGMFNITAFYGGSTNYTANWSRIFYVNVTQAPNTAPDLFDISAIPAQSVTEGGISFVDFSFLVTDVNGADDLNDASAFANFSRAGEEPRINSSCSLVADINSSTANYTCRIGIQYFDGAGVWNVSAGILDSVGVPSYRTETFNLNEDTCMVMSPTQMAWTSLSPGDVDSLASSNPIIVNNTCNDDIDSGNVRINAIDLYGEQDPAFQIPAANFTGHTANACSAGTALVNGTATGITGSILAAGNNSAGQGQEELYLCLEHAPNALISQPYSTARGGSWEVSIVLALFAVKKRKKKRKITEDNLLDVLLEILEEKLNKKQEISLSGLKQSKFPDDKIQIPLDVFTQELGAAESLSKFLKENLSLPYSKIAKLLNRDQRTIWINYNKASKKKKEKMSVKNKIKIPIEIFSNRKLSILESLVKYLKELGFKNSEIAKLLNRDSRNIWTLYSRAVRKTQK